MPNAVKLWQTALRQLQQLPTVRQEAGSDGSSFPLPAVHEFLTTPRGNASPWKRLVKELKVPLHLGQAVASTTDPFTPRSYAAINALGAFWRRAMDDDILFASYTAGSASSLGQIVGQQLQQSGFIEALPLLLDVAAAALADTQHEPALAQVPQHCSYVLAGRDHLVPVLCAGRTTERGTQAAAAAASRVLRAQSVAGGLLEVLNTCMALWPHSFDTGSVLLQILHLCATTMQHCSHCADLMPPAAAAPTALQVLMFIATAAIVTVCTLWKVQDKHGAAFASSAGHPVALQAVSMVLLALTLRIQSLKDPTATADKNPSSTAPGVRLGALESDGIRTSQAAWQYACSNQSELSELQQQTLQELGCGSGRALMYAAGHVLRPLMTSHSFDQATYALQQLAQHSAPLPQLDVVNDTQQFLLFTAALVQHKEGDSPPCGSQLLPCAALLWLAPAVLLEWLQKQPADWACTGMCHQMSSRLLWLCLAQVQQNQQFWALLHAWCNAFRQAGQQDESGDAAMQDGQDSSSSMLTAAESSMLTAAVSSMLIPASRVALGFNKSWTPSASQLAQLLHLTSSFAAQLLARMQDSGRVTTPGNNTATASSSGSGASASDHVTRVMGSSRGGRDSASASHDEMQLQSVASVTTLSMVSKILRDMVNDCLWVCTHTPAASTTATSSSAGGDGDWRPGPEQQADLASLVSALQQTLPQQASVAEAALRSGEPLQGLMRGSNFMQQLCGPGMFVAAGLQQGSPAAKALCSLSFTLLKMINAAILAKPQPDEKTASAAASCLRALVVFTAMFVKASCASSSNDSNSHADEAVRMLSHAKGPLQWSSGIPWGAEALSSISSSTGSTTTVTTGSHSDAVALVPWLVSLGRCCTAALVIPQQSQAGVTMLSPEAVAASHVFMEPIEHDLRDVAAALHGWLQSSSTSAHLAAAGYNTQLLIEQSQWAVQAGQDAVQAGTALVPLERLQQLGLALSNLPFGTACNNPRCTALAGLSEQQLVVGRARLCAGCLVARYCCRACQVAAWKQHRPACKAVARASVAKSADQPA